MEGHDVLVHEQMSLTAWTSWRCCTTQFGPQASPAKQMTTDGDHTTTHILVALIAHIGIQMQIPATAAKSSSRQEVIFAIIFLLLLLIDVCVGQVWYITL